MKSLTLFLLFFLTWENYLFCQEFPVGFGNTLELSRRKQLSDTTFSDKHLIGSYDIELESDTSRFQFNTLPLYLISKLANKRPYGGNDYLLIPGVGFQQYVSSGVFAKWNFLSLQFQPEISFSQNKSYQGFSDSFDPQIIKNKYHHWNKSDYPERFGDGWLANIWWGQSKLTARCGAFEIGGSTKNIWWGPSQWNSLTFSNNAQGFAHLTLNTTRPAKTFLGYFETQLIIGKLNSSGFAPSQYPEMNNVYFKPLPDDWRYLNALMVSYNPKWVPGLFLGAARTFQVFNENRGNSFYDWFPVFEPFQKKKFFEDGNTVDFDANGRDQQMVIFGRYLVSRARAEIYFEFGKRDHSYNWREFVLNPEHARAYIFGFNKLFDSPLPNKLIQIRTEILHQQESINRIIRYLNPGGNISWGMHHQARGFTNYGQGLGVGSGQGANVQTFELSLVENYNKLGFVFERLENDQGFYYRSFYEPSERKPWIDLSLGFLYDKKFDNLLVSSKLQVIHAKNYQWQLDPASTPEFPKGENLTSMLAQVSLIYFWK